MLVFDLSADRAALVAAIRSAGFHTEPVAPPALSAPLVFISETTYEPGPTFGSILARYNADLVLGRGNRPAETQRDIDAALAAILTAVDEAGAADLDRIGSPYTLMDANNHYPAVTLSFTSVIEKEK